MATQEIAIPLDFSRGSFDNVVYENNQLRLIQDTQDDAGHGVYRNTGSWISEVIVIKDKVTSFRRIARNVATKGSGSYKIYTASSPDRVTWSPWTEIDYANGGIFTPVDQYAKVKIELFASKVSSHFTVDDFTTPDKYTNPYVNSANGVLELNQQYFLIGTEDMNWNDEGKLFSTKVNKSKFKAIDRIEVV
ncbi:hypothetical protein JCM10914A_40570 [Paenibacillus sp. JCM 10914]|uniref:hypothetical protein n=1 Tax=Paenibacillus sp. JCM 10914 TaxID=1236974 RepID=UPI0003CC8C44|nr:hypothetical protein [Paenibacillus sp. JCM 10914]GAE05269.1 hypothetical protein JCM10914_1364 [Paenibacillus sp. JCM 10914]